MGRRLSLSGKNVMITGAAGGIGLAVARQAAARGATPILMDLDASRLQTAVRQVGGRAVSVAADVTDLPALCTATDRIADDLGGIDVVIANAGIGPVPTTVDAGDRDHQRRVFEVNLLGVLHTVWAAAHHVRERTGHIAIVSSAAAFLPGPGQAAYAASKAAVEHVARAMRVELAPCGTTVGVAHFGYVDTRLMTAAFETDPLGARMAASAPAFITRPADPSDVGQVLVRGIERRAARTVFPRWWLPAYWLRGIVGPLADAWAVRDGRVRQLMTDVRDRDMARERSLDAK